MNFTDLIKSGLYPTTSKALAIRDNSSAECPFGDFFDVFHFVDFSETRKLVQVGILKNKRGFVFLGYYLKTYQIPLSAVFVFSPAEKAKLTSKIGAVKRKLGKKKAV